MQTDEEDEGWDDDGDVEDGEGEEEDAPSSPHSNDRRERPLASNPNRWPAGENERQRTEDASVWANDDGIVCDDRSMQW